MSEFWKVWPAVFTAPGPALARLRAQRAWPAALLLLVLATALFSFMTFPIQKADQAEMIRESRLAEQFTLDQLESMSRVTPGQRYFSMFWSGLVLTLVLVFGTFFVYLFYKVAGTEGLYSDYFTLFANASLIDVLAGGAVRTLLTLLKGSTQVSTSLALLAPGLEKSSMTYLVLSQFDFFSLWFMFALAVGIAAGLGLSEKKSLVIMAFYFAFKASIVVLFSYLSLRLLGI